MLQAVESSIFPSARTGAKQTLKHDAEDSPATLPLREVLLLAIAKQSRSLVTVLFSMPGKVQLAFTLFVSESEMAPLSLGATRIAEKAESAKAQCGALN